MNTRRAVKGDGSDEVVTIRYTYTGKTFGKGVTGYVAEVKFAATGEMGAIKSIDLNRFGNTREVEFLKKLKHCNIVKMMYYFSEMYASRGVDHIIMECMPASLLCLYFKNLRLIDVDIKLYMYQLLRSLAYIHARDIFHRDIKPLNILIDPFRCVLKLCDFGMSEYMSVYTRYSPVVCTFMYRAPELFLGSQNYRSSIDIWSAGCILVELLKAGVTLFNGKDDPMDMMNVITDVLGTPPQQFFDMTKLPLGDLPKREAKPWTEVVAPFPISDDAISLCNALLSYEPSSRPLAHEALAHKFFDELRSPETTHLGNGYPLPPLFNFQPGEFPGGFDHLIPSHMRKKPNK